MLEPIKPVAPVTKTFIGILRLFSGTKSPGSWMRGFSSLEVTLHERVGGVFYAALLQRRRKRPKAVKGKQLRYT